MTLSLVPFASADDRVRTSALAGWRWLSDCTIHVPLGNAVERPPRDEEQLLVVLSGTHDLAAGGGGWAGRGLRATPFDGRPCALYLPPRIGWSARGESGELLVFALRVPAAAPAADARKPLLPLAGSGKAYDSGTGAWQRIEDLPSSPEAILPRRIAAETVGGVRVEHVFAPDYKAAVASLDEAVLAPGQRLALAPPAHAGEVAIYFRSEGTLRSPAGAHRGEGVLTGAATPATLAAEEGRTYLAILYAGPKATT